MFVASYHDLIGAHRSPRSGTVGFGGAGHFECRPLDVFSTSETGRWHDSALLWSLGWLRGQEYIVLKWSPKKNAPLEEWVRRTPIFWCLRRLCMFSLSNLQRQWFNGTNGTFLQYSISVFLLFSTVKSCSFARDGLRFAANLPFFPPLLAIGWSWEGHLSRIAAAWGQWRTYEVIGRWINSCNYISIPGLKSWAFVAFPLFDRERWWWWWWWCRWYIK